MYLPGGRYAARIREYVDAKYYAKERAQGGSAKRGCSGGWLDSSAKSLSAPGGGGPSNRQLFHLINISISQSASLAPDTQRPPIYSAVEGVRDLWRRVRAACQAGLMVDSGPDGRNTSSTTCLVGEHSPISITMTGTKQQSSPVRGRGTQQPSPIIKFSTGGGAHSNPTWPRAPSSSTGPERKIVARLK